MLRRWFLILTIVCAMVAAPVAMADARVQPSSAAPPISHCADRDSADGTANDQAPAKQFRCMGACSGVEARLATLTPCIAATSVTVRIGVTALLAGTMIEHEPPPPRLA